MKINRSHLFCGLIVSLLCIVWVKGFWFTEVFRTHNSNARNRAGLVQIYESLRIGAAHSEALELYWKHRTDELRLHAESPTAWVIRMPLEFGGNNRVLWVGFQNGGVSAVRVRKTDGPSPKGGPTDKQKDANQTFDWHCGRRPAASIARNG